MNDRTKQWTCAALWLCVLSVGCSSGSGSGSGDGTSGADSTGGGPAAAAGDEAAATGDATDGSSGPRPGTTATDDGPRDPAVGADDDQDDDQDGPAGDMGDQGDPPEGSPVAQEGGSEDGPYAHVVAVSTSGGAAGYTFSVSVESADVDCSQYANWWEVLGTDGTLIFRRILVHSHTDGNGTSDPGAPGNTFTRSGGPVSIEGDREVLVRAHMSTGGYRGTVMRGSPDRGFQPAADVDGTFAPEVETEPPQPDGCQF